METTEHGSTKGGKNKQEASIHYEITVNAKLVLDAPKDASLSHAGRPFGWGIL